MEGVVLKVFWVVVDALSPVIGAAIAALIIALIAWVAQKLKLNFSEDRRWRYEEAVRKHVKRIYQTFVQPLKAKSEDGKLTRAEGLEALRMATDGISADTTAWYRKTRDAIKEDIEGYIGGLKVAGKLAKAGSGNP